MSKRRSAASARSAEREGHQPPSREPGDVESIAERFEGLGRVVQTERAPYGHIHQTWFAIGSTGACAVVQRLNDRVFPDCELVAANVARVSAHLVVRAESASPPRQALRVLRTREGEVLVFDGQGGTWRAFAAVRGATCHPVVPSPEVAFEVGRTLGRFAVDLADLPGPALVEPIGGFKDFEGRRRELDRAVEEDAFGRVALCAREIEAVRARHRLAEAVERARHEGLLPTRTVHNDAKAANVLVDSATGEGVCVIDLDTVAPGTVLFDIGDLLRSATVTVAEDTTDLPSLAVCDNHLVAALRGYLSEAGRLLTTTEKEMVPLAGPLMAYENAMRFLTDHLDGDRYFGADRPRHNLDRARAQLRVLDALAGARSRVAELVARG
ncbi:MAG: aminoglycoside phosphotransferase family protein [Actinomycetota bacterium]